MIIQIRGTSGSGKSTVMRRVMEAVGGWTPIYTAARKRPLYYYRGVGPSRIVVVGHYESACGGGDTIGSAKAVYDLIDAGILRDHSRIALDENGAEILESPAVLCEGLLLSEDTKWSSQLPGLRVIFLTTPLERCLAQIEGRRKEAGNDKPLNPANTVNRVAVIERARVKLTDRGILCRRASADQAVGIVLKWLRESSATGVGLLSK